MKVAVVVVVVGTEDSGWCCARTIANVPLWDSGTAVVVENILNGVNMGVSFVVQFALPPQE